jgi:hypothetical protein
MNKIFKYCGFLLPVILVWMTAIGSNKVDSLYIDPLNRYLKYNFKTEKQWDTIRAKEGISGYPLPGTNGKVNYAFHPFWMGTAYNSYEFQNITRIGYFAYFIFSNNSDWLKAYSWTTTSLLSIAGRAGCKVDLVVFCSGFDEIELLLNDNIFQAIEVENIISLASSNNDAYSAGEKHADGVNVYFKGLTREQIPRFKFFLQYLKQMLHEKKMDLVLSASKSDTLLLNDSIKSIADIITTGDFDYYGNTDNGMYITTSLDPGNIPSVNSAHVRKADTTDTKKDQPEKTPDTTHSFFKKLFGLLSQTPFVIRQLWYELQDNPADPKCPTDTLYDRTELPGFAFILFAILVLLLNILSVICLILFLLYFLNSFVHDFITGYRMFFGITSSIIVFLNLLLLILSSENWWQVILLLITVGMIFLGIMPLIHMKKKPLP